MAVLLALMVGSELMGVLGAVLAVPVTAAISVIVDEIRTERLTPAIDVEDVVSDDLLPKEGVVARPAPTQATISAREDAIDAAEGLESEGAADGVRGPGASPVDHAPPGRGVKPPV
jgi:hypothetical protein